jgi:hypothetical protein
MEHQGSLPFNITEKYFFLTLAQGLVFYLLQVFKWYCTIYSCIVPYIVTFRNFVSMDPWMCSLRCLWWSQNRMSPDRFSIFCPVDWLLVIEISELGKSICEVKYFHQDSILFRLLWLTRLHVWLLICHNQAITCNFLILWKVLVWQLPLCLNIKLCLSSHKKYRLVLVVKSNFDI